MLGILPGYISRQHRCSHFNILGVNFVTRSKTMKPILEPLIKRPSLSAGLPWQYQNASKALYMVYASEETVVCLNRIYRHENIKYNENESM